MVGVSRGRPVFWEEAMGPVTTSGYETRLWTVSRNVSHPSPSNLRSLPSSFVLPTRLVGARETVRGTVNDGYYKTVSPRGTRGIKRK